MEINEIVKCQNSICGREYHKDFEKCPFCGAVNMQYDKESAEKHRQQKKDSESVGKGALRIFISIVVALIAIALLSSLSVLLNISGTLVMYINAGLAVSCGVACNRFLKKKFSTPKK